MAPGQEIAIRAVGTALAGLSLATAIHMLAYGGAKRVNGAEYVAISPELRGQAVETSPVKPPAPPVIDIAATGSLPAAAGKPALHPRPAEIVAARADRVWLRIDGAIRAAAPRQAALAAARSAP
jgi:hypothetical protein